MKTIDDWLADVEEKLSYLKTGGWAIDSWFAEWEDLCKKADNPTKREQAADELFRMTEKLSGFADKLEERAWEFQSAISDYQAEVEQAKDPCPEGFPPGRPL